MNAFFKAISGKKSISIIAEIKKSSPSHGPFTKHTVKELVEAYESGRAKAISVVTDPERFDGSITLLKKITTMTCLPVLRKDFINTREEIDITKNAGASAVLLIAHNLTQDRLHALCFYAISLNLTPVIEVHTQSDLDKAHDLLSTEGIIIGINNRNLNTLTTDVFHALSLLDTINFQIPVIVESAISSSRELKFYQGKVDGALIGTALLVAENPKEKLWQLQA